MLMPMLSPEDADRAVMVMRTTMIGQVSPARTGAEIFLMHYFFERSNAYVAGSQANKIATDAAAPKPPVTG